MDRIVLAIDDSEDDQFLFTRLLRRAGVTYPIENVASGGAAIELLGRMASGHQVPLVCFLDIKMPRVDGFDVLQWIRERPELNKMPVVMLSSSDQPLDVKRAAEMHAQGFLKKHPTEQQMRSIVAQVADAAHQHHPIARIESSANLIRAAE